MSLLKETEIRTEDINTACLGLQQRYLQGRVGFIFLGKESTEDTEIATQAGLVREQKEAMHKAGNGMTGERTTELIVSTGDEFLIEVCFSNDS